ncbi:bifunctional diguanylate cyclase/phosphodiesterase [Methylotenera sp. G11]|uniref:bifunctional diguanylate cyclase/phosphodiesterase n=1 Tax=Methylotenera sp. G11 TaxID=1506585 RepID=UPI000646AE41|nr:EAL domain-containing protein [Methylotenera sp. G11]
MSLIKQLWLAIVVILSLAFAGAFILSTVASKHYFEQQLQAKNDDNATTLALSITQIEKDPVALDLLISAQFDTGHYHYIGLVDPNGKVISERINNTSRTKAPDWFVKFTPLRLQPGQADIQDGWSQYGTLKIESDSNVVYDKLWDNTVLTALWVLLIGFLSGVAGSQILRRILNPLSDVVSQAESIGENRFITISVPRTKEFKAVVNAMNTLSNRVKKTVSEESARLDQLRLDNNYDHITGLMNHDYFVKNLDANISHEEYFHEGALIISRLTNLAAIDHKLGYKETNTLLKAISDTLQNACSLQPGLSVGRLNGTDFAVFSNQPADSYSFGNHIKKLLEKIEGTNNKSININFTTVAMRVTGTDDAGKMIALSNKLLNEIGAEHSNVLHVISSGDLDQYQDHHENEWLNLLTSALDNRRIKLERYPVINQAGNLLHFESPARLQLEPDGKWFCAGEFITWATQLNLMTRLDELAFETAAESLSNGAQAIGLNVSASAMRSQSFIEKITGTVRARPHIADKLYFEIPEQEAFDHLPEFHQFCRKIRALGCKIGIEHVGTRISRLGELHDIGLHYIKIDASVIRDIDSSEANKTLLRGLCMIAHSIGVIAIAEGVHTQPEIAVLKQIGIDGMTGPGIRI